MKVEHKEEAIINVDCEIRIGIASWDDGSGTSKSVKFACPDKNGKTTRGGEFPVKALLQALNLAIKENYISLK